MKHIITIPVLLAAMCGPAFAAPTVPSFYRFDVTIDGLDSGKPAQYTMVLEEGQHGELATGANIPLTTGDAASLRYDVGLVMRFDFSLRGAVVVLAGDVELSSGSNGYAASSIVHKLRAHGVVPLTADTPALFTSLEDLGGHHHYEMKVAAHRLL